MPMTKFRVEISRALDQFEDACTGKTIPGIEGFLPEPTQPYYSTVLGELIRVDMDIRWGRKEPRKLREYVEKFPQIREDTISFSNVCYEDYRQRRLAGEDIDSILYEQSYGIPTTCWQPILGNRKTVAEESQFGGGMNLNRLNPNLFRENSNASGDVVNENTFCNFTLVAEIDSGAVAKVYLASQTELANRFVVLKISRHFPSEPHTLSRLQHTNIVPIHSVHRDQDKFAMCMPFMGITTFRDVTQLLKRMGRMPESGALLVDLIRSSERRVHQIFRDSKNAAPNCSTTSLSSLRCDLEKSSFESAILMLFSRIADGLSHAHQKGIFHRDLKPANILLADSFEPMLLDFNLADDGNEVAVSDSCLGGTLPYMAPEQMLDHWGFPTQVDARSDLYAFGVMLFELLTGRLPFPNENKSLGSNFQQAMLDKRQTIPDIRKLNPAISASTAKLVEKCLQPCPHDRFQSARQLKQDLDRHLANQPMLHVGESYQQRVFKWTRRNYNTVSKSAIVVAALGFMMVASTFAIHIVRHNTTQTMARYDHFEQMKQRAEFQMDHPRLSRDQLTQGLGYARQAIGYYNVLENENWQSVPAIEDLPTANRVQLIHEIGRLLILTALGVQMEVERDYPSHLVAASHPLRQRKLQDALRYNQIAETCFSRQLTPKSLWVQRGGLLDAMGDKPLARKFLEIADDAIANSSTDYLLEARAYFVKREYHTAAALLHKALLVEPERYSLWYLLGQCQVYATRYEEAIESFSACLAFRPEFCHGYLERGICHYRSNNMKLALRDLNRVLQFEPRNLNALVYQSKATRRIDSADAALKLVNQALKIHPEQPRLYYLKAQILKELGDKPGCRLNREMALELNPTDAEGWMLRGMLRRRSDPKMALRDFTIASKTLENWSPAQLQIARIHFSQERHQLALETLTEITRRNPDYFPAAATRGIVLAEMQHFDEAQQVAGQLLQSARRGNREYKAALIYATIAKYKPSFCPNGSSTPPTDDHDGSWLPNAHPRRATSIFGAPSLFQQDAKIRCDYRHSRRP